MFQAATKAGAVNEQTEHDDGRAFVAALGESVRHEGPFAGTAAVRARALGRTYRDLVRLLRTSPEVVLYSDRATSLHVDGIGGARLSLRGAASPVVRALVEALRRRDVHMVVFRRGVTEDAFVATMEMLGAPQPERASADDGVALAEALLSRGTRAVVVVLGRDCGDDATVYGLADYINNVGAARDGRHSRIMYWFYWCW